MYRSGDKLLKQVTGQSQQQIALCELENFCENLCLSNRILLQQIAQIQSDSILWDLLLWQNSVEETKIFTKISSTNKENCLCDVSKQCVNSLKILANPKSQSFITPSLVIRMFSGFTSLWTHWKRTQKTLSTKHAYSVGVLLPIPPPSRGDATILDKINGKPRSPPFPKSRMVKCRVFALRAASSLI